MALVTDAVEARQLGRRHLEVYLAFPNCVSNLRRLGFDDEDLRSGGSDRLVDAMVAWGDEEAIAERIRQHRDAGADHVCIQVIGARGMARQEWRRPAPVLTGK